MRILLINPAPSGILKAMGALFPPLGFLYIAARVEKRKCVQGFDKIIEIGKISVFFHKVPLGGGEGKSPDPPRKRGTGFAYSLEAKSLNKI